MTIDALVVSRTSGRALVGAGGRFVVGNEMGARAEGLGMRAGGLFFRGRIGALGEVSGQVAMASVGIFPRWVAGFTWRESAALPAMAAAGAYGGLGGRTGAPLHVRHAAVGRSAAGRGLRTARASGDVVCRPMRGAR
jgi:hypothetical protein